MHKEDLNDEQIGIPLKHYSVYSAEGGDEQQSSIHRGFQSGFHEKTSFNDGIKGYVIKKFIMIHKKVKTEVDECYF